MNASSSPNLPPSPPPVTVLEDCFGVLKLYSDGSVFRDPDIKNRVKTHDDGSAVWKDCVFDPERNLTQRIYKPAANHSYSPENGYHHKRLPVVYYLHAGGFCFPSSNAHNTCLSLCSGLQAIVIMPYYRLAPEHRLPAAIEDVHRALKYLQDQALMSAETTTETAGVYCEGWLRGDGVDLDRVFIFGDSSGGNIAHHLAVQLGRGSLELRPIRIRGYILLSPFFGGVERTKREEERPNEDFWSQEIYDQFWRLAMPMGADKDHPLVNPVGAESRRILEGVRSLDPIMVVVGGDEVLRDRAEDYAEMMMKQHLEDGSNVSFVEFKGKQHGFFTSSSYLEESQNVIKLVNGFISQL